MGGEGHVGEMGDEQTMDVRVLYSTQGQIRVALIERVCVSERVCVCERVCGGERV